MGIHEPVRLRRAVTQAAAALSVAFVLLMPAPVAAQGAAPANTHTGTVGVYSLNDSSAGPGAQAIYKYGYFQDYWKLKRIVVRAPNVRAVSGKTAQKVGWDFTIQKRFCGLGGCLNWSNDYTSPTFKAVTDDVTNAAFSDESVGVRAGPFTYDGGIEYRAIVKVLWYRPSGSVQGTAKVRVHYYLLTTGSTTEVGTGGCGAWDD